MDEFNEIISLIDVTLDSHRKRHIVGGILLSVSLLFGGLAFTTMTIDKEEAKYRNEKHNFR